MKIFRKILSSSSSILMLSDTLVDRKNSKRYPAMKRLKPAALVHTTLRDHGRLGRRECFE